MAAAPASAPLRADVVAFDDQPMRRDRVANHVDRVEEAVDRQAPHGRVVSDDVDAEAGGRAANPGDLDRAGCACRRQAGIDQRRVDDLRQARRRSNDMRRRARNVEGDLIRTDHVVRMCVRLQDRRAQRALAAAGRAISPGRRPPRRRSTLTTYPPCAATAIGATAIPPPTRRATDALNASARRTNTLPGPGRHNAIPEHVPRP
jgi:hypothetical protein